ncbi:MAG: putative rane protein YhaH, family [Caulobacter sp.]|nr:putative rane protein YhaH, family [Caulobacter sp.]
MPPFRTGATDMGVPHLYSLEGRIGRREFVLTQIGVFVGWYFFTFILIVIGGAGFASQTGVRGMWEAVVNVGGYLAAGHAVWISLAAAVKRCHDRGLSGLMLMFAMPPVIGQLWLFLSLVAGPGEADDNRYGPARDSDALSEDAALA